jgi:hypothetical protein
MFDETDLHSLISRESEQRGIHLRKLLRESLLAAADGQFKIRVLPAAGKQRSRPKEPIRHLRKYLRRLAGIVAAQNDWGWWHKQPWSDLKCILVKQIDYSVWLDRTIKPTNEAPPIESKSEPKLKIAPESKIDQEISAEYDEAERKGLKPPNLKEIARPVLARLRAEGYQASQRQILKLAEAEKHKGRRRPPGRTVATDKVSSH